MYRCEVRRIVYQTKVSVTPVDVAKAHAVTPFAPLRPRMRDGSYVGISMEAWRTARLVIAFTALPTH